MKRKYGSTVEEILAYFEQITEELEKKGLNQSITHVDFMIGSEDMDIDGITKDGQVEALFRNGNWVRFCS